MQKMWQRNFHAYRSIKNPLFISNITTITLYNIYWHYKVGELGISSEMTTIQVTHKTRKRLASFGRKGETYEDIITELLDKKEKGK